MLRRVFRALLSPETRPHSRPVPAAAPAQQPSATQIAPAPIAPAYGVLLEAATQELNVQLSSADALDTKAATIFSVASTVAVVVPALLPLGKSGVEFASLAFAMLCLAGLAYVATLVLFLLEYRSGVWLAGPRLDRLREIITFGEDYSRRWAADAYILAIGAAQQIASRKARYYR